MSTLSQIEKKNGKREGNQIIDKFSGYIIRKIDYDVDEGYEEGYKKSSREVMEQDAGDALLSGQNKQIKYQTVETQMAANVINAMATNMGINIEEQREFMLKIFSNVLPIALPSESDYKKRVEEAAKKGKNNDGLQKSLQCHNFVFESWRSINWHSSKHSFY
jgi:hypothetical protein